MAEHKNRIIVETTKSESDAQRSLKESNLAQRGQVLNEQMVKLECHEKRVQEQKIKLKDAQLKYKQEEEEY